MQNAGLNMVKYRNKNVNATINVMQKINKKTH